MSAAPSRKKPRLDQAVVSDESMRIEPAAVRVGRTKAVRFYKAGRCWRVGTLTKLDLTLSLPYCLQFENAETECLTEKQFRKSVMLAQVRAGTRVSVHWKDRNAHYAATVTKMRASSREGWNVVYDDFSQREWINLNKTSFQILSQPANEDGEVDDESDGTDEQSTLQSDTMLWTEAADEAKFAIETEGAGDGKRLLLSPNQVGERSVSESEQGSLPLESEFVPEKRKNPKAKSIPKVVTKVAYQEAVDVSLDQALEFYGMPDDVKDVEKGCRIALWWPGKQYAVVGTVFMTRNDAMRLDYGGGHKEWVDLRKYRFKILLKANGEHPSISPQNHADTSTLREPDGDSDTETIVIGSKLAIYWAATDTFHACTVIDKKSDGRTKPFRVSYENGDREWVRFDNLVWKFQTPESAQEIEEPPMLQVILDRSENDLCAMEKEKASGVADVVDAKGVAIHSDLPSEALPDSVDSASVDAPPKKRRGRPPKAASLEIKRSQVRKSKKCKHVALRTDNAAEVIVGSRVKIYEPAENSWTMAMVTSVEPERKAQPHQVEFDNGTKKWMDFDCLTFRFLRGSRRKSDLNDASSDEVDLPAEQEDNELEILPGSLIRIWDPSAKEHFNAKVLSYRRDDRDEPYYIELENGDTEWTGFEYRSFRFLPGSKRCHSPVHKTKLYQFPEITVGTRLHVWWETHNRWFIGTVSTIRPDRERPHFVEYDDGDHEWLDLKVKRFMVQTSKRAGGGVEVNSVKRMGKRKREEIDSESGLDNDAPAASNKVAKRPGIKSKAVDVALSGASHKDATKARVELKANSSARKSHNKGLDRPKRTIATVAAVAAPSSHSNSKTHKLAAKVRIGSRVSVWWDGEAAFFAGTVTQIRNKSRKPFRIEYDDGDEEWVDLANDKFRLLTR